MTTTKVPFSIKLSGPAIKVFQEVTYHARRGYTVNPDAAVEIYPTTGQAFVHMIRGEPLQYAEADAEATIKQALEVEQGEYARAVAAEAARIVSEAKAAAVRKEMEAAVTAHAKQLRKLEADLASVQ